MPFLLPDSASCLCSANVRQWLETESYHVDDFVTVRACSKVTCIHLVLQLDAKATSISTLLQSILHSAPLQSKSGKVETLSQLVDCCIAWRRCISC